MPVRTERQPERALFGLLDQLGAGSSRRSAPHRSPLRTEAPRRGLRRRSSARSTAARRSSERRAAGVELCRQQALGVETARLTGCRPLHSAAWSSIAFDPVPLRARAPRLLRSTVVHAGTVSSGPVVELNDGAVEDLQRGDERQKVDLRPPRPTPDDAIVFSTVTATCPIEVGEEERVFLDSPPPRAETAGSASSPR